MTNNFRLLKWGINSMGCPEKTIEQISDLAYKFKIPYVELRSADNRLDFTAYLDEKYPDPQALKDLLSKRGQKIISFNTSFKLVVPQDEKAKNDLLSFARWADILDVKYLRAFGGGTWGEELTSENFDNAKDNLKWWNDQKVKNGFKCELVMETHDAFSSTDNVKKLFEEILVPIKLIWDSHHTWRTGGEEPSYSYKNISEHIVITQVKDSIDTPSARHPFTYVQLGEGQVPLNDILGILKNGAFTGVVSIEWEKIWHPYLPELEEALDKASELGWV